MKDLLLAAERWLPHWLESPRVQWVYGIWQVIRCNPLTLLVLSLPLYLWVKRIQKKSVVVVGDTRDYEMSVEDLGEHQWRTLELVRSGVWGFFLVKHRKCCYLAAYDAICELAACEREFGENVVFVERLLPITDALSVGRRLSRTEAYERVLSCKGRHISKGPRYIVPTLFDYIDLNSKLWGVLSTIPIILQARSYNRVSTLLSLVIILLDLNRHWLYEVYDNLFEGFTKFVKLRIFKRRSSLYDFFSVFSSRWMYCDPLKKHAYVFQPDDTRVRLRPYSKLKSCEDLEILGNDSYLPKEDFVIYMNEEDFESYRREDKYHMEIEVERAHFLHKRYDDLAVVAKLRKPIYVL